MTNEERAHDIVAGVLDICGGDGSKRSQLELFIVAHLDEVERRAAEKAMHVYRDKVTEAATTVSSQTAIGRPTTNAKPESSAGVGRR